ncbi:hypothetical protein [uncultured Microbacterium sp.]|uniref:hypothetical protein n=1 Tax=uncultured Microbacterium sp. TaxID=191216 RepID=UPI0028DCAADF|nr:hypothetical protein [uncultured Microbacterium sp.]
MHGRTTDAVGGRGMSRPPRGTSGWWTAGGWMVAGLGVIAGTLVVLLMGALGASASGATATETPDVEVALVSDSDALADGDDLVYTAVVTNRGAALQAKVVLTPPSYITLGTLDRGGVLDQGAAVWTLPLAAGESTTIEVPATVGEIPDGERRATALISLYVDGAPAPVVRSASADAIAGVDDRQAVAAAPELIPLPMVAGLAVALAAGLVAVVALTRRRAVVRSNEHRTAVGGPGSVGGSA